MNVSARNGRSFFPAVQGNFENMKGWGQIRIFFSFIAIVCNFRRTRHYRDTNEYLKVSEKMELCRVLRFVRFALQLKSSGGIAQQLSEATMTIVPLES